MHKDGIREIAHISRLLPFSFLAVMYKLREFDRAHTDHFISFRMGNTSARKWVCVVKNR